VQTPSCYVIGDSISLMYGPHLEAALGDRCRYFRKDGMIEAHYNLDRPQGANGGDSGMVRHFLEAWAVAENAERYDLLAVNCGLHDIKLDRATRQFAVDIQQYRANLTRIVQMAPSLADRFAWIRTTPVDDELHAKRDCGFDRFQKDVDAYNAAADEVMRRAGVPTIDLHAFTLSIEGDLFTDGVHFLDPVCRRQGEWMAERILEHRG